MSFRTAAVAGALLVAFVTATLAPCPAPAATSRATAAHAHHSGGEPSELAWVAACPCGCERTPVAGSSVRLGVALLPAPPEPFVRTEAVRASAPLAPPVEALALRIEHVPLPALA